MSETTLVALSGTAGTHDSSSLFQRGDELWWTLSIDNPLPAKADMLVAELFSKSRYSNDRGELMAGKVQCLLRREDHGIFF